MLLSARSYASLTADPSLFGIACPSLPPLPDLVELPAPGVSAPSAEVLVRLEHPRITSSSVYRDAGWPFALDVTLLRSGAAERLYRVADSLPERFGLFVFDAYRPLALQREIFEVSYMDPLLPPGFVSPPSEDPTAPPPHLSGGALDVTLSWDGVPLALGSAFDDFTPAAHAASFEAVPGVVRDLRRLLFWSMHVESFRVLPPEWWHFEYGTCRWAALTGSAPLYGPALHLPSQRHSA